MKIGIFGGTFNPTHIGHISAAISTLHQLNLDLLLVVPTGIPPHKEMPAGSPSGEERYEMASRAFQDIGQVKICDIELKRKGKSYTSDTIDWVMSQYPGADLWLLVGTDMLSCMEIWKDHDWILKNVRLAAFRRGESETADIQKVAEDLRRNTGARITLIDSTPVDISSSDVRGLLPRRGGHEYMTDDVYESIISHRFYGAKPNYDWLRIKAYSMLKPERILHVAGCEEEAVRLARRWGADENDAREAAILHDITKRLQLDEQLLLCERYGIINDGFEKWEDKLLHAETGAAIAKDQFGASDSVCEAIRWHTTGKAGMSIIEKVVYMADYIEPSRAFAGLDELRRTAYEDIDQALAIGLQMSIDDMRARGITPHRRTEEALRYLL